MKDESIKQLGRALKRWIEILSYDSYDYQVEMYQSQQTKINELEAQHRSVFVAGWRPFCGWICSVALFYNFVIRDLFIWAFQPEIIPPAIQMDHLMTILMGMLGLGGLRTYEKIKDKSK